MAAGARRRLTAGPRGGGGWPLVLAAVVLAAAVLPQVVNAAVYPGMSPVLDAAVYTRQADLLAEGHVTIPDEDVTRRTEPFFTTYRDGRWVFKYLPGTAALLALGQATTGSWRPAVAAMAALLALGAWGLSRALGGSARAGVLAAAVVALSPMTLALGGFALSYVPAAALIAAGVWAAADGEHHRGPARRFAAGALFGAAFWFRQLEVAVWFVALVGWLAVTRRRTGRPVGAALVPLVAATVPLLAGVAVFDWVVVGAPWRLPFSLSPQDRLGFGTRRVLPDAPATDYGVAEAWQGLRLGLGSFATWLVAAAAVLPAAAWAAVRGRARWPLPLLLAAVVPAAGFFFWGSWYVTSQPDHSIYDRVGPFYLVAALVPVAVLAGAGLDAWLSRRAVLVAVAVMAAVAVQVPVLAHRGRLVGEEQAMWVAFERRMDELAGDGTVVLVDDRYLDAPFQGLRDLDPGEGGDPTYLTYGAEEPALAELAALAGDRPLVRARIELDFLSGLLPVGRPEATPVRLERGPALGAELRVTPPAGAGPAVAALRVAGQEAAVDLPATPSTLVLQAVGADVVLRAPAGGEARLALPEGATVVEVAVRTTVPGGAERVTMTRVPVDRPAPGQVRWLVPAPVVESTDGRPEQRFSLVLAWPEPSPPAPSPPGG